MEKNLPRHSITFDEFESLLMEDADFTHEAMALLSAIIDDLHLHVAAFNANTSVLI